MREIKFRAWDSHKKQMCYQVYVGSDGWHAEWHGIHGCEEIFDDSERENILMQYTGLKDKNGKEIFEEDIVVFNNSYVTKIIFKNGAFEGEEFNTLNIFSFWDFTQEQLEIIGNLYENPNLLKEEK